MGGFGGGGGGGGGGGLRRTGKLRELLRHAQHRPHGQARQQNLSQVKRAVSCGEQVEALQAGNSAPVVPPTHPPQAGKEVRQTAERARWWRNPKSANWG